jgi:hypothetical protein
MADVTDHEGDDPALLRDTIAADRFLPSPCPLNGRPFRRPRSLPKALEYEAPSCRDQQV